MESHTLFLRLFERLILRKIKMMFPSFRWEVEYTGDSLKITGVSNKSRCTIEKAPGAPTIVRAVGRETKGMEKYVRGLLPSSFA